jgi:hypothetical protein
MPEPRTNIVFDHPKVGNGKGDASYEYGSETCLAYALFVLPFVSGYLFVGWFKFLSPRS